MYYLFVVAWCLLRVVCCLFVVLLVGVCLLLFFSLLDRCLQCFVCGLLSGADVILGVRCLLFAACCDNCGLRLVFVVCRVLCVVV